MERSIADRIVDSFLEELAAAGQDETVLAEELRSLIERGMLRREDALVEMYERRAGGSHDET